MLLMLIVRYNFVLTITPRLLRSTLFPYTTLFRSDRPGDAGPGHDLERPVCVLADVEQGFALREEDPPHLVVVLHGDARRRDRKSTRLNSSHVKISYAVFCLKKKKDEENSMNLYEH